MLRGAAGPSTRHSRLLKTFRVCLVRIFNILLSVVLYNRALYLPREIITQSFRDIYRCLLLTFLCWRVCILCPVNYPIYAGDEFDLLLEMQYFPGSAKYGRFPSSRASGD